MAREKKQPAGAPLWMVTFADLMSILVCFFVLIISFSTLDQKRFFEMVGSVKQAFGIDNVVMLREVIELDGVPFLTHQRRLVPVPIGVIAVSEVQRESNPVCQDDMDSLPYQENQPSGPNETQERADRAVVPEGEALEELRRYQVSDREGMVRGQAEERFDQTGRPLEETEDTTPRRRPDQTLGEFLQEQQQQREQSQQQQEQQQQQQQQPGQFAGALDGTGGAPTDQTDDQESKTDRRDERQDEVVKLLNAVLAPELESEVLSVEETREGLIKITFPEKATFASGSDGLAPTVLPVIDKVAEVLAQTNGEIAVLGHTDNVPISTPRFPSNWELSTARAIRVLRRLELSPAVESNRLLVMGFADTQPVQPNDTPENRASNRRVEIVLRQP